MPVIATDTRSALVDDNAVLQIQPQRGEATVTIIMTVSFHLLPDKRDEAIAAALAMQAATTREPGCSEYRFWTAADNPNALGLFERWDNQQALDAHLGTPHMAAFGQAMMTTVLEQQAELTRYEVASRTTYSGSEDV